MKAANQKTLRWFAPIVCGACWAYALVTRFTNFFIAPGLEKLSILGAAFLCSGLLAFFIFHEILPRASGRISHQRFLKAAAVIALAAAILLLLFYQPPYFPENHQLMIEPFEMAEVILQNRTLQIDSVQRIEQPGGERAAISPDRMVLQGFQPSASNSDSLGWNGDLDASIRYDRLMQAGIEIIFQSGPQSGQVRVRWDGQEQIIDLNKPSAGIYLITLDPKLDWRRTNPDIQIMLAAALAAEFLGLTALIGVCSALLFPSAYGGITQLRAARTLIICMGAFLVMLALVAHFDPVVHFQDPQLEASVRQVLGQPEGNMRLHKLLTIASLDASTHQITNLEGIQQLRNLSALNLRDNAVSDITPLSALKRLRELNLRDNAVSDLSALATLTNLEALNLGGNSRIRSIAPLAGLSNMQSLNLRSIPLGDQVSLLAGFPNLQSLNIRSCGVSDISVLGELMAQSALQDDPRSGTRARLDIRDNPIPHLPADGFAALRPFWQAVSLRAPFTLPVFNTLAAPAFSHSGGFYDTEFLLELSSQDPQAAIHYTLDGSEPTQASARYSQSLRIRSRAGQPNTLSAIQATSPFWIEPLDEVFKATVVRARVFHSDGAHSAAVTHTYFIDPDMSARYSLPIVSIVTDPHNLFDYDQGIYVMGRVWDELYDPMTYPLFRQPANYNQRGAEWERPVHIEFFKPGGERALVQDGGVRIHGGVTRSYPQKTLRLVADAQYGYADSFDYELFPGLQDAVENQPITNFKTLLLRNSGNDWRSSMLRDALMQALVSHTSLDIQAYQPAVLFLNGEYWGIHNLRERMDAYYLAAHYQVQPEHVVILENNSQLDSGERDDERHYQALVKYIETHDISADEHYKYIATQMDIDNFIDYQTTEIYIANTDWLTSNVRYWRYKTDAYTPDAPYGQDGRWRWMLFDTDMSFGISPEEGAFQDDMLQEAIHPTPEERNWGGYILRSLIRNSDFRRQFISRFADHLNTSFELQRVISIIDEMQAAIAPEMPEHIRRWHTIEDSPEVWEQNIEAMRTFARRRPEYVRQHILDYFGLPGTARITLQADSTQGHIRINSIDILSETPGVQDANNWVGIYFQGIPVSLTAIPNPGYQFAGWEGIDQSQTSIQFIPKKDLVLKASFILSEE